VVLLGDPQQLAQVSKGSHPAGAEVRPRARARRARHVLPERGIFLDRTHRMHPAICEYVSPSPTTAAALRSRLRGAGRERRCAARRIRAEMGAVEHRGQSHAVHRGSEGRCAARRVVGRPDWIDASGQQSWISLEDILVITPYNARVVELTSTARGGAHRHGRPLPGAGGPVAIYSLARSSADDVRAVSTSCSASTGSNVAVSRARCPWQVVVGSPALLRRRVTPSTSLRLANALCQFVDDAETVRLTRTGQPQPVTAMRAVKNPIMAERLLTHRSLNREIKPKLETLLEGLEVRFMRTPCASRSRFHEDALHLDVAFGRDVCPSDCGRCSINVAGLFDRESPRVVGKSGAALLG